MSDTHTSDTSHKIRNELRLAMLLASGNQGDARAYQEFLYEISRILRSYFIKRGLTAEDAEDVIQEVLLSIHKARHTYDSKRPIMPWVFAITRYRFADFWRKKYSNNNPMITIELSEVENILASPVTESTELPEGLDEALAKLPEKKRRILYLLHYEGCTAQETAKKLGMKESAVKVAAHRMYKEFRTQFDVKPESEESHVATNR